MSSAVAAARKRRAGIQPPVNTPPPGMDVGRQQPGNAPPPGGLTLQQVINVINGRLLALENSEKERREAQSAGVVPQLSSTPRSQSQEPLEEGEVELPIGEILSEYESRFEFLTQELSNIKEIVLKLQSYTMDINRILLEERNPSTFTVDTETSAVDVGINTETAGNKLEKDTTLSIQTDNLSPLVTEAPAPPLAPVAAVSQPTPAPQTGKSGKKSVSISGV